MEWSDYLDRHGLPWRIDANVVVTPRTSFAYTKSYRVVSDLRAGAGGHPVRLRILRRVDELSARRGIDPVVVFSAAGATAALLWLAGPGYWPLCVVAGAAIVVVDTVGLARAARGCELVVGATSGLGWRSHCCTPIPNPSEPRPSSTS